MVPSTSYVPTRQKRSYEEDDDDDMDDMDAQPQKQREPNGNAHRRWIFCVVVTRDLPHASHVTAGPQNPTEQHSNGECKRQELEAPSSQTTSASHLDLNFPLPGEKGPSCLVKVRRRSAPPPLTLTHAAPTEARVSFAGVRGLGTLQGQRRAGILRRPLRQSGSQRPGR